MNTCTVLAPIPLRSGEAVTCTRMAAQALRNSFSSYGYCNLVILRSDIQCDVYTAPTVCTALVVYCYQCYRLKVL